jgi:ASC-1-like (ASCH) protein
MNYKTHEMKLDPSPFNMIKSQEKTVEMRLFDERRKNIKVGDKIRFTCRESEEELLVRVTSCEVFPSFDKLYDAYPKKAIGYRADELASPRDMEIYYSPEDIKKYGAFAIGIEVIK